MLLRGGLTAEDAELTGEALARLVLGIWNRLVAYVGTAAPQMPTQPTDNVVAPESGEQSPQEPQDEPEQRLVTTTAPSLRVLSAEERSALVSVLIRRDILANQNLLWSFQAQTAHLAVTRYSPDVGQRVAVLKEATRVLAACHAIHENLQGTLKQSQSTSVMQALARQLFEFVGSQELGEELVTLAGMISIRLGGLHTKSFKLSSGALDSILGAPTLLDALLKLSAAVENKLDAQEAEEQRQKRPSRHEIAADERRRAWEKRQAEKKASSSALTETVDDDDEDAPAPVPTPLPAFVHLGKLLDNDVYGRINWGAIDAIRDVSKLRARVEKRSVNFHALYETAMRSGIQRGSSTGSDCTKPEGGKVWVVKVSYPTAKSAGVADLGVNIISPYAEEVRVGKRIELTFDKMVFRH